MTTQADSITGAGKVSEAAEILRKAKEHHLTADEEEFLQAVKRAGGHAVSWQLPSATRAQDRARARLKRDGLVVFIDRAFGWKITDLGRVALDRAIALAEHSS